MGNDNVTGTVTKINVSDGTTTLTFNLGTPITQLAFDGSNIWAVEPSTNSVAKVRGYDGLVLGTFPVGSEPYSVAFDGTNIWVANLYGNTVMKLRRYGRGSRYLPVGSEPLFHGLRRSKHVGGQCLLQFGHQATGLGRGQSRHVPVGVEPTGIAFDGSLMWIVNYGSNSVTTLLASTGAPHTYTLGAYPYSIAYDGSYVDHE